MYVKRKRKKMRALYQNQQEKYKKEWYRIHKQTPPNLGCDEKAYKPKQYVPCTQTITDTTILEGFTKVKPRPLSQLEYSYWVPDESGPEPVDYQTATNTLNSDEVIGWKEVKQPGHGKIIEHSDMPMTPYQNDQMAHGMFETMRAELEKRAKYLAQEMKRVEDEFYRPPAKNWFTLKKSNFTKEHIRFNELKRRNAAKREFADYYRQYYNNDEDEYDETY